jgi:hypothetical protein
LISFVDWKKFVRRKREKRSCGRVGKRERWKGDLFVFVVELQSVL